jgi:hypothetical protein
MTMIEPERVMGTRCNTMVDGHPMSYPCTRAQGHTEWGEPHYAVEIGRSVRAWQAWHATQEGKAVEPPEHPVTAEAQPTDPVAALGAVHAGASQPQSSGALFDEQAIAARRQDKGYSDCSDACLLQGHTEEEGCVLFEALQQARREAVQQEPTKQRAGDQVIPDGDEAEPDIQSLVILDVQQRRQVGIERYGQGLRPFNGRDTLLDAYEESVDLTTYLRSLLEMQRADRERMRQEVSREVHEALGPALGGSLAGVIEIVAERVTTRVIDAFAFPGKPPEEVVHALAVITTPTRMAPEKRIEAGEVVKAWLQGH